MAIASKWKQTDHPLRLRMVRTYLLAILICTFLFFSVSLISLVQQQNIIREHSRSSIEVLAQRIAAELEQRIQLLAADTLSKNQIDALNYKSGDESVPIKAQELQRRLEELRREHPIVENFIIFNLGGHQIFPGSSSLPVQSLEAQLPTDQSAAGSEFMALQPYKLGSYSFRRGTQICQMYYTVLPGNNTAEKLCVGFVASLPYIREQLLPEYEKQLDPSLVALLVDDTVQLGKTEDIDIPLPTIDWMLRIPGAFIRSVDASAQQELWYIGAATAMFLCILGLGIVLLIRVSWHIRWYQVRSDFVSGISHDLKTPLSLIRLYSETLAGDEQSFPPEERKNFIRIIARESERLSRLIDNVLDFSRIEKGKKTYELYEGDLAVTVAQTVEDYSDYLNLRGFSVKTGIQPNVPSVKFNREEVSQAILNLLDNARKYSGDSRLIRVHLWLLDGNIIIEIQDYGVGIPQEEIDNIFQPFYRVANQNEKGGCGLGLYLVAQVMQNHNGRIEVESELGKGSRFRLYFPVVQV
jgi:signal transduction histidine kinase